MHAEACTEEDWQCRPVTVLRTREDEVRSRRATQPDNGPPTSVRSHIVLGRADRFPARAEAERCLMRAVLVDAIRCLAGEVSPFNQRARLAAQARRWIKSRDEHWPFSFENICLDLDLQAERLRRLLLSRPQLPRAVYETMVQRLAR